MPQFIFTFTLLCSILAFSASSGAAFVADSPAIMRRISNGNMCALTFDDGPSQLTPKLLDSLYELGIKATFFVLGTQVEARPHLILRMIAEGHEIANHSYSHPNMRKLSPEDQYTQLSRTKQLLENLGVTPRYFRPPYGNYTADTVGLAAGLGMSIILWSTDSKDWKRRPKDYAQMDWHKGKKEPAGPLRGIFLFHDTKKNTVDDLPLIASRLRDGGCDQFVTVSEYFHGLNFIEERPTLSVEAPKPKPPTPEKAENITNASSSIPLEESVLPQLQDHGLPYIVPTPAGSTPIPMARSIRIQQRPELLRGSDPNM